MRSRRALVALLSLGLVGLPACTGVDPGIFDGILNTQRPLDEATVAAGLREALAVATGRSVETLSSMDGFLGNALLRIAVPEQFESAASTLRNVGLGSQVDAFETAMNRSAERACGEARQVFWDQIRAMSIADAFGILRGADDAATQYFRTRTEATLRARFTPIVQDKMSEVGLYGLYNDLADAYDALPLTTRPALDLDAYITDRALDGLFTTLAGEEARIREDPVARTTDLLKRVFGSVTAQE